MDAGWGNDRGGYLGEPPRRAGFGRKTASLASRVSDGFTLSNAAEPEAEVHAASGSMLNDIDFSIGGGDMQYVEIELDPGEAVIAEPGAMIWKDSVVVMDTVLGDGSPRNSGFANKVLSAGTNMISGEGMFMAAFRHGGTAGKARLAFSGRIPGHIIPVRLDAMGKMLICQRGSFLAAAKGVSVSVAFQRNLTSALFGGEDFVMQRLYGEGWVFLHVGGTIIERDLAAGEIIHVDGGCVAAHEPTVEMDIDNDLSFRGIKSAFLGGEGLWLTTMRGPGKVWIQTLPFARVAAETAAVAPGAGIGANANGVGLGDVVEGFHALNAVRKLF